MWRRGVGSILRTPPRIVSGRTSYLRSIVSDGPRATASATASASASTAVDASKKTNTTSSTTTMTTAGGGTGPLLALRRRLYYTSSTGTGSRSSAGGSSPTIGTAVRKKSTTTASSSPSTTSSSPSFTLKPWSRPVVACHGDYRDEAWLETEIGGPLYEHQASLPHLPVPAVADTMTKFMPTALPLAESDEERVSLEQAVAAFPHQSTELQRRLLHRKDVEYATSSWLQHWWNTLGYLQVRDSVMINVSYFFHFQQDPTCSSGAAGGGGTASGAASTSSSAVQIRRAAAMITATAQYRQLVCSGQLPAEKIGRGDRQKTLCSTAYKYMFNATRIPHAGQDTVMLYDPSRHNHLVVACRGQFYRMEFCDPTTGTPYPVEVLERGLQQCRDHNMASTSNTTEAAVPPLLGILTSNHRDHWAAARVRLLETDAGGADKMDAALTELQSAAFVVCLDDASPVSRTEMAKLLCYGDDGGISATNVSDDGDGGITSTVTTLTPFNRWYDKSFQLVVTANGHAGLIGEHSMMDGMPVVGLADHITKTTYASCVKKQQHQPSEVTGDTNVRPIFVDAMMENDDRATAALQLAAQGYMEWQQSCQQQACHVQSFQGFGSSWIKKAGYSPDAFVQVAIQLATYRLWNKQVGTYEASQVRPFLHGRTETTRAVSTESAAFVDAMGLQPAMDEQHDAAQRKNKLQLLQDAVLAHVKYIGQAAQAAGVDRHFFGLSMLVGDNEQAPDLFSHPVYQRSKRWRVSTSHLTHPRFLNWGYGQVVPDGIGLAYSIHPQHCIFNITALEEHQWTDKASQLLEDALLEMQTLVEIERKEEGHQPKSKL